MGFWKRGAVGLDEPDRLLVRVASRDLDAADGWASLPAWARTIDALLGGGDAADERRSTLRALDARVVEWRRRARSRAPA